jgi:hypothetical protein
MGDAVSRLTCEELVDECINEGCRTCPALGLKCRWSPGETIDDLFRRLETSRLALLNEVARSRRLKKALVDLMSSVATSGNQDTKVWLDIDKAQAELRSDGK